MSELARLERLLLELLSEMRLARQRSAETNALLSSILTALEEPTTYPASSGGSITVSR